MKNHKSNNINYFFSYTFYSAVMGFLFLPGLGGLDNVPTYVKIHCGLPMLHLGHQWLFLYFTLLFSQKLDAMPSVLTILYSDI